MYDLVIKNGTIVDGTGRSAYRGDIGIRDQKIEKIGDLQDVQAHAVIDAAGKTVTPGFIEPHSHVDMTLLFHPSMETYLMQGVTTVVSGNCGHGMAPMGNEIYRCAVDADRRATEELEPEFFGSMPPIFTNQKKIKPLLKKYFDVDLDWHTFEEFNRKCESLPIDCNIAPLVGHSAIRNTVMGADCRREATEKELQEMERLLRDAMEQGAFGFSTGRDPAYEPSVYGDDAEIIRLLKIVKEYDGIFSSHTANFLDGTFDNMTGYREFFRQANAAAVRANISHVQLMAEDRKGAVEEAQNIIKYFEENEAQGLDFSYDVIPIADASFVLCPYLASVFAPFVRMLGTRKRLAECLAVPDFRDMVRAVVESGMLPSIDTRQSDGIFGRFYIAKAKNKKLEGKLISVLAKEARENPLEYAMKLLTKDPNIRCGMSFQPCRKAYDILINHRFAMPCIDGSSTDKDTSYSLSPELPEYPAPFYYNGMISCVVHSKRPRFEDTIRQMTGFVAERFQIPKRGELKEGNFADILVMDRMRLQSYELDENERKYPDGLDYVVVNGAVTIEKKKHLGVAFGQVLRKEKK
ncbi:amidohydrolase family protein [Emergencia sp. 1XD21-10]|jgi:N-acyl-D-aspartate/D-glutamate deacylase|uniref:N-acyl-D-amino-acid deacylase family protein n=1 Tax=Emergencia sp. 1XD21-10 TaxID=2304569 RepID=UPI00137A4CD6|nr:amidohydrolase family protein [Emergencia sp. 1XD21-10]NCE98686.1 hypothetical protein [Emergencia sp. 1XD21-10]